MNRRLSRILALVLALIMALGEVPALAYTYGEWPESYDEPGCDSPFASRNDGNHRFNCTEYEPAGCVNAGYAVFTCVYCGKTRTKNYKALGHDWSAWEREVDPDCTHDGLETRYCQRCWIDEERAVAGGHDWGPWQVDEPGTCVQKELLVRYCRRCGQDQWQYGNYGDHDWGEWQQVKAPTRTEPGLERRVCKIDPSHTEEREIPADPSLPEEAAYTLLGLDNHYPGWRLDEYGTCWVEIEGRSSHLIWKDDQMPPHYGSGYYPFMLNPVRGSASLESEPVPGETYYFMYEVSNNTDNDHSVDFDHIDPDQVHLAIDGFAVSYLFSETSATSWGSDQAALFFSATYLGSEEDAAEYVLLGANDHFPGYRTDSYSNHIPQKEGKTGGAIWKDEKKPDWWRSVSTLTTESGENLKEDPVPGQTYYFSLGEYSRTAYDHSIDFTQVDPALVTVTMDGFIVTYLGAKTDVYNKKFDMVTLNFSATYTGGEEPQPDMSLTVAWDEGVGEGKRYEGAVIPLYVTATNTGSCPIYPSELKDCAHDIVSPHGFGEHGYLLEPGESMTFIFDYTVRNLDVDKGFATNGGGNGWTYLYFYQDAQGDWKSDRGESKEVTIPLTYPDGEEPEPGKAALTLVDLGDSDWSNNPYPAGHIFDAEDNVYADYTLINNGEVPLTILLYYKAGHDGFSEHIWYDNISLCPSEEDHNGFGTYTIINAITPGTETDELLGTYDLTFWFVGYDPETYVDRHNPGTELCRTQEITRSWPVRKPGPTPWPIPEESELTVVIDEYGSAADPSGYQLGEFWDTMIRVFNKGTADVDKYTLHVDILGTGVDSYVWDMADSTDSASWFEMVVEDVFPAGAEDNLYGSSPFGEIEQEDVERGHILLTAYVTWIDPDSGNERQSATAVLSLPVTSKTGLLLQKFEASTPENGEYYTGGEAIEWKLSVTNNSAEPITNVVVSDQGMTVGVFEVIDPGQTVECAVPDHIVTKYESTVVGYVTNQAQAVGADGKGAVHTWYSNTVKVTTGEEGGGASAKLVKSIVNGKDTYALGDEIEYRILLTNTGTETLENIEITDSLAGLSPIGGESGLNPGESALFQYKYTVTQADVDAGKVLNTAFAAYAIVGVAQTPIQSNEVVAYTQGGGDPGDPNPGLIPPVVIHFDDDTLHDGSGESCFLDLSAVGDYGAQGVLHACPKHLDAAQRAEAAALAGDAAGACGIWLEEIESLYALLWEAADSEAKAAVLADRAAFALYVSAYRAQKGDAAAVTMLRLRCAEMCCMIRTAPQQMPDSLLSDYAYMMDAPADACGRSVSELNGSDAAFAEQYDEAHGKLLQAAVSQARAAQYGPAQANAFTQAAVRWQMALDSAVNAAYKAADKEGRKLIAAARTALDAVVEARGAFLTYLYPNNPETVAEAVSNLYRGALLDEGE